MRELLAASGAVLRAQGSFSRAKGALLQDDNRVGVVKSVAEVPR
jgi:hypothetical protein